MKCFSIAPVALLSLAAACSTQEGGQAHDPHADASADKSVESTSPVGERQTDAAINTQLRPYENDVVYPDGWVDPLLYIEGQLCQHLRLIHEDRNGGLWFGTNVYGVMHFDGDSLQYLDINPGLGKGGIRGGIREDPSGTLWFGASTGLVSYDGKAFALLTAADGLPDNDIWSMLLDKAGMLWIGTAAGLCRYDGQNFTPFPFPKGQVQDTTTYHGYDRVTALLEDRQGRLWIGTDGFGLTRWDGTDFDIWTMDDGLQGHVISGFLEDREGNIWISTMYGGISRWDGKAFRHYSKEGLVEGQEVGSLYEDRDGSIWFAVENVGVYRFDGSAFKLFAYGENGLNTNSILNIHRDRQNRFWFGGWGGLFRFDGREFTAVTREGPWAP